MLDEIDGRAFAIDSDGMRQVEITVNDGVIRERGDIIHACVLGIDLSRADCKIASTASRIYAGERDLCAALDGQIAACPQSGIGGRGRLGRAAVNRQVSFGEQTGEEAFRHDVRIRDAQVTARRAAAGANVRGVAVVFRRRNVNHAAVFDSEIDSVDARI